jgi:hypothetical protein
MAEATNPEVPGVTNFTIYVPNFLQEYSLSEQSLEQQNNELLQKDHWLTAGLIGEIESLFLTRSEINNDNDNKCDPHAFQHKIAQHFASGRIFASFKQLDQAADMFLGTWVPGPSRRQTTPKAYDVPIWRLMKRKIISMWTYPKDKSLNQV